MKLVLAEEQGNELRPERAFTNSVIKIGRDPADCQLVFEQGKWPMVSRRHAEFRLQTDGRCLVADINSSFGTLVDGKRISGPTEVQPGARVQFGLSGPVMRVIRLESSAPLSPSQLAEAETERNMSPDSDPAAKVSVPPAPVTPPARLTPAPVIVPPLPLEPQRLTSPQTPAIPTRSAPAAPPPAPKSPPPAGVFLEHVRGGTGLFQDRLQIAKDKFTMGRDPSMDLVIALDSAVVSRRHAEIRREASGYMLADLGSFNGTLVNERRITAPTPVFDGDQIQLGPGGPVLKLTAPAYPVPAGLNRSGQMPAVSGGPVPSIQALPSPPSMPAAGGRENQGTMVLRAGSVPPPATTPVSNDQLLMQLPFGNRPEITIGRANDNTIRLDGLQISNRHARIVRQGNNISIEDTGSTNGIYVNGKRIQARGANPITENDLVQIGPFRLKVDGQSVAVFDTRSKTRLDVLDIIKRVPNRSGPGEVTLLDDVDLTVQPNEFVGLLGPSGAGKSTLMDAMNGMRPATSGQILINGLNLYENLDSFKQSIGYVPQEDIIHRELTVYRTLYYVAKLRLSRDVSEAEIDQIIGEVLDVTGLAERHDVLVSQLSGGQRKRVSIAVELITKPSVIYLDEPTSGLDPATEEKIMRLFRQIAESGRTVVLTTHAMENVKLFDKIVVLMRGKLVWYGPPMEALKHFKADSFKDLYDKIEAPIAQSGAVANKQQKESAAEQAANNWRKQYEQTPQYKQLILDPLGKLKGNAPAPVPAQRTGGVTDSVRQLFTLAKRYKEVLFRDKINLGILFGQAPIIGLLTVLATGANDSRDFPMFMLALVAIWFGTSLAAREIIRERPVYNRERMVNLGLMPYIGSKLLVLSFIVGLQCTLLFVTLKAIGLLGELGVISFTMPGNYPAPVVGSVVQLIVMIMTGIVGIMIGLFISAIVKTSEMATSLVPLILIPQLLFAGLVSLPQGLSKVVGLTMPATWSFDEMKRLSGLGVLRGEEEGGQPSANPDGKGLFKQLEQENKAKIDKANSDITNYKRETEIEVNRYKREMDEYLAAVRVGNPATPPRELDLLKIEPVSPPAERPESLSKYVDFLHPWGNVVLNPLVLILMFLGMLSGTLIALRSQDIA